MRFGNREYRITLVIITVVLALPIMMHVVNGLNSRMLADDYCFAANVQSKGFTGATQYYYYNWQGTFSSTAVQSGIALMGSSWIRWLPVILIIGWWIGLIYLAWQVCEILNFNESRLSAVVLATLILYAILEGAPTVFQSIYWTSGSVTYAVPMVLFTLWSGLLLHAVRRTMSLYVLGTGAVIAAITAGLLAGFSPIFAVFELGVLALMLLTVWLLRPNHFRSAAILVILSLIGAAIGMFVMVAAPGNSVRQSLFDKPPTLLALIGINLTNSGFFVGMDLYQVSLLPHLVVLVIGGWLIASGVQSNSSLHMQVKRAPRIWLLMTLCVALLLLFGLFLPTSYNISQFPPGRALIIPHVVMVALTLTWGGIMALGLKKYTKDTSRISIVTVSMISILLITGPLLAAGKSAALSSKLQTFSTEWDARDSLIQKAKGKDKEAVSVSAFTVDLAKYAYLDTSDDSFVSCLQDYYHVQNIVVQK
jgi:hypothetical protein